MSIFIKKVKRLILAKDEQDWEALTPMFADKVTVDYSSMGIEAKDYTSEELIKYWKSILPGFTHTHHQLSNFLCSNHNEIANVFCYTTIQHYLEDEEGNLWTVVGTLNFELKKYVDEFKFTNITFNFKFQDGNLKLLQKAKDSIK